MVARVLAVLAALFLVSAVAIAALSPFGMTLGQGMTLMDGGVLATLQRASPSWLWSGIEIPLLLRPLWLVPAAVGLICVGAAASLSFGKASPSRRRRS